MKMELTEYPETSAHKIMMPGNRPKERKKTFRKFKIKNMKLTGFSKKSSQ